MCRRLRHLAIVVLFPCVACGSADPLRVTAIQVGRSLNADGTIATHATTFAPNDNIYLSVRTAGSGATGGGEVVAMTGWLSRTARGAPQ